jgi:hypothetical protein
MEARFSDLDFARRTYESVVQRTIDSGVCTALLSHIAMTQQTHIDYDMLLLRYPPFGSDQDSSGHCSRTW